MSSRTRTRMPVSSSNSRATPCSRFSPSSSVPPGMDHSPRKGSLPRRINSARPRSMITPPIPTTGLSGYSLEEAIREVLADSAPCCSKQPHRARELTSYTAVYNTLHSGGGRPRTATLRTTLGRDDAVIRCPECSAEIDVDEDEVEEGEILSCPECESELEVSQTHPVHLNLIADDEDEEDDEEEEGKVGENGDLIDDDDDEEEEEEDEE